MIVPINGILQKNEQAVIDSFKQSNNFTAMKSTKQSAERRWILLSTNEKLPNLQVEADNMLGKFHPRKTNERTQNNHRLRRQKIVTNHFSAYAAVLFQTLISSST